MILEGLNEAQKEAVMHGVGPMMILAGAGTGKTRVIATRIVQLVESGAAKPSEILALTFTEKAASEMVERLDVMMPLGYEEIEVRTFHGFCERVLRERGHEIGLDPEFKILSKMKQWNFLRRNLFRFPLKYYRPLGNPAKYLSLFMSHFDRLKDEFISPEEYLKFGQEQLMQFEGASHEGADYENCLKQHEMALLYAAYQEAMAVEGYMDFGDLVYYALKLLETRSSVLREYSKRYRFIMVDEFQDTNYVQTRLALLLAREHGNIAVVGDDDQSIYRWRGASLSNVEQFEKEYPSCRRVVLHENYRSRTEILDSAYRLIQGNNPNRLEVKKSLNKRLTARKIFPDEKSAVELQVFDTYLEETGTVVRDIALEVASGKRRCSDFAILARTNSHLKAFADELLMSGVPFQIRSTDGILQFDEVKDLVAVARATTDPHDAVALYRVLSMPVFGLTIEDIFELLQEAKKLYLSPFEILKQKKTKSQSSLFHDEDKLMKIAEIFHQLMEYGRRNRPSGIFLKFLELSGYVKYAVSLEDSRSQRILDNLNAFAALVAEFEKSERDNSIFDLLQYFDIIEKSELPQESARAERDADAVELLTVHSAKGLEFPVVYIVSLVQNRFPSLAKREPFEIPRALLKDTVPEEDCHLEEERRLLYVAMTRAQERLILTYARQYEGARKWKPSIFLSEIFEKCETSSREFEKTSTAILRPSDDLAIHLPRQLKIPLGRLSYTQFDTFKQCPLKYSYRYLMMVPTPQGHASSYGTSIHNTLKEFYQLMKSGAPVSLDTLLQLFEKNWIADGYESRGHEEKRRREGREVLTRFFEVNSVPAWTVPTFLERPFSLKIGQARVTGRIDRIDQLEDGTYEVIDYKTGSSKKDTDLERDLQLSLYALACRESLGIAVSRLSLYFIDDNVKISTTRTGEQLEQCRSEILELVEEMLKSDFQPTPGFHCRFCDFRLICPVAK